MDPGLSLLPQEGLWRATALLRARVGGTEIAAGLVPAIAAAVQGDDRLVRLVLDPPPSALDPQIAEMFPPLFDAMLEFWSDSAAGAIALLERIEADASVRAAAAAAIDAEASIIWLAQVFPIKQEEGRSRVKFLAGGHVAEGWAIEDAQRYWRDVHPEVAKTAPGVWGALTRYVQFHGAPVAEHDGVLGRWRRVPMCAEMGFADARDFIANYSSAEYRAIVRPDEEKFSRPGEMLAFVSGEERVLDRRS